MKKTLVIGASTNPMRYSYLAVERLRSHNHEVIAYGVKSGKIADVAIETIWNEQWEVDTVTLYLNPTNQEPYYDRIIALKPRRVIFNPGTENTEFSDLLNHAGIQTEIACTLVLLSLDAY